MVSAYKLVFLAAFFYSQFYTPNVHAQDCVVLLHGLARTSNSMWKVENFLESQGYTVVNHGYPSTSKKIEELSRVHVKNAHKKCLSRNPSKIHFVTHSMGGILVRYYLEKIEGLEHLGHVVMLAPPNKGSELVDRLSSYYGFDLWNGPAGEQLGTNKDSIPNILGPVHFSLGVIAGTKKSYFLSRFIDGPNDGKVSVESTKVSGMADHITFNVNHTFIMNSKKVIEETAFFLEEGSFSHFY
jgi:pimeloyl-ACP methyl ester carboxylesterase